MGPTNLAVHRTGVAVKLEGVLRRSVCVCERVSVRLVMHTRRRENKAREGGRSAVLWNDVRPCFCRVRNVGERR